MQFEAFAIPLWAELSAVALGGLQGALFAATFPTRRIDVLGVIAIGIGVALGGAILRDILLGVPPAAIRGEWYVLTAAGAALVGMWLEQLFARAETVIVVLDAVVIGVFGAIGTSKALSLGVPWVPAVFIGAIAAVGGSVLRDVSLALPVALLHVGPLAAVAAAAGSTVLVALAAAGVPILVAGLVAAAVTTVLRLLAVRFGWRFPEQAAFRGWRRRARA